MWRLFLANVGQRLIEASAQDLFGESLIDAIAWRWGPRVPRITANIDRAGRRLERAA